MIVQKNDNLFSFFKENKLLTEEILDILRYDVFGRFYYYGDHFKLNSESKQIYLRRKLIQIAKYIVFFKNIFVYDKQTKNKVISNAYFELGTILNSLGFTTFTPPWQISRTLPAIPSINTFQECNKIITALNNRDFSYLVSESFIDELDNLRATLETFFVINEIKALIFPNDLSLFENLSLKIAKKLGIPTFISLHGLPGRYNGIDDNRADYLMVWGEKIKQLYIESGVNAGKIIVTGHPIYSSKGTPTVYQNSLENILILTISISGKCDTDVVPENDRTNFIYYLYSIEKTLKKLGVKNVRIRCHPCENINWYLKCINNDFFIPETKCSINEALSKSTLVIGPTSTMLIDAVFKGINYIVYEPITYINKNLNNTKLVPPFDKGDERIPIAYTESELEMILSQKRCIEPSFTKDYIAPNFDLTIIKDILKT